MPDPKNNELDLDSFLNKIAELESSGGKNTSHQTMQSGIHAGDTAIGRYGLMPNTIQDVAKRSADKRVAGLAQMPKENLSDVMVQSPELEDILAKELAQKILNRQQGDEEKAAYAWNQGSNLKPEQILARDYVNSPYVQKFRRLATKFRGR